MGGGTVCPGIPNSRGLAGAPTEGRWARPRKRMSARPSRRRARGTCRRRNGSACPGHGDRRRRDRVRRPWSRRHPRNRRPPGTAAPAARRPGSRPARGHSQSVVPGRPSGIRFEPGMIVRDGVDGVKVSECFTPDPVMRRNGFDRLIRLAIGLEDEADLRTCLECRCGSRLSTWQCRVDSRLLKYASLSGHARPANPPSHATCSRTFPTRNVWSSTWTTRSCGTD